jgi:hypothetical protein
VSRIEQAVAHNSKVVTITGIADYAVYYDKSTYDYLATNLIAIDAKKRFYIGLTLLQLLHI